MNSIFNTVTTRKITVKPCPVLGTYLDVYPESDDIEYYNDALINTQYGLVLNKESIAKNSLTEYIYGGYRVGAFTPKPKEMLIEKK